MKEGKKERTKEKKTLISPQLDQIPETVYDVSA